MSIEGTKINLGCRTNQNYMGIKNLVCETDHSYKRWKKDIPSGEQIRTQEEQKYRPWNK
jgi:hypothetical protein